MEVTNLQKRVIKVSLIVGVFILLVSVYLPYPVGKQHTNLSSLKNNRSQPPHKNATFKEGVPGIFELPPQKTVRKGPGENGLPHYATSENQNEVNRSIEEYGINMVVSDQISLYRSIPDERHAECKYWHYPQDLPTTSVIIVFHNEGFSTLLRTIHSVLDRSPPQFLKEVVLVDDFSDKENLKGDLDDYIKQFGQRVHLIRNKQREGLIRSKTYGAQHSIGEVVLFLDAHCEVNVNWLPPLLAPIYADRTVMTVPTIDQIDKDNFEYRPVYEKERRCKGIFEWGLVYKETEISEQEEMKREHYSKPYKSPTHAGGLFAINREYFLELGAYDPGLLVWGGENFELSFKIWTCGGSIEWIPCSRVGHIYRSFMPYSFGKAAEKQKAPIVVLNYKRVVEVWMEDYKEYFYIREPLARQYDHGDVSEQLAMKKRLQCKSFKWYMENIAYDVLSDYPLLPENLIWGKLKSLSTGECIDTLTLPPPSTVQMYPCYGSENQVLRLNVAGQLGVGEGCIFANLDHLEFDFCDLGTVDGPWEYHMMKKMLYHKEHKKCVELSQVGNLTLIECNDLSTEQKWIFEKVIL